MDDATEQRTRENIAGHIVGLCRKERLHLSEVLAVIFAEVTSGACAYYGGKQTAEFLRQTACQIEGTPASAAFALYTAAPMGRA